MFLSNFKSVTKCWCNHWDWQKACAKEVQERETTWSSVGLWWYWARLKRNLCCHLLAVVSAQYHPLLKTKSHDILSLEISILISVIFQDLYEPCAYHSLKDHGYEQLLINPLEYFVVSHFQHIHRQNIKRREGYEGLGETSQCPSMYINQYLFQCPYITLSNTSHHNFFFSRQHPIVGMQVRFPSVPIPPEEDSTSEWINDQVRSD